MSNNTTDYDPFGVPEWTKLPVLLGLDLPYDDYETKIPPEERTFIFYFIISFYLISVPLCFVINLFFAGVVIYLRKDLQKRPFFRIVWQLVIANILSTVSNFSTTFPITFLMNINEQSLFIRKSNVYKLLIGLDDIADQVVLYCILFIALHRLLLCTTSQRIEQLFNKYFLNLILLLFWLLSIAISIVYGFFECSYKYSKVDLEYSFLCNDLKEYRLPADVANALGVYSALQVLLFPLLALVAYCITIGYIIRQKNKNSVNRVERTILQQALLLFVAFQIVSIVAFLTRNIKIQLKYTFFVRRIINTLELLAGVFTPLSFFVTSKEFRKAGYKLLPWNVKSRCRKPSAVAVQLK